MERVQIESNQLAGIKINKCTQHYTYIEHYSVNKQTNKKNELEENMQIRVSLKEDNIQYFIL